MKNYAMDYAFLLEKVLNEKYPSEHWKYDIDVEPGKKFDRIVLSRSGWRGRSVHAFVERETGLLIKAATWKAPAKRANGIWQSKFDLSVPSEFKDALDKADPYGRYLYLN